MTTADTERSEANARTHQEAPAPHADFEGHAG